VSVTGLKRAAMISVPILLVLGQLGFVLAAEQEPEQQEAPPCPGEQMGVQATGEDRNEPIESVVINGAPWSGANWAPGHRSFWHCHAGGQLMVLFEGEGRVQRRGERVQTLHPGESHMVGPGEEHWHGGAPNQHGHFLQVSILPTGTFWMEEVTDTDYLGNGNGLESRAEFLRTGVRSR